jgi:hypothetical protein
MAERSFSAFIAALILVGLLRPLRELCKAGKLADEGDTVFALTLLTQLCDELHDVRESRRHLKAWFA